MILLFNDIEQGFLMIVSALDMFHCVPDEYRSQVGQVSVGQCITGVYSVYTEND